MLLDGDGVPRELVRLGVGDRETMAIVLGDVHGGRRMPGLLSVGEYHPNGLSTDGLAQDRRSPRGQIGLVDVELVGVHRTLHDGLPEAVRCGDQDHLVEAGFRVEREHDARGAEVAAHHALDTGGKRDIGVRVPLMDAVGDRAIVVEAGKYLSYCMKYII